MLFNIAEESGVLTSKRKCFCFVIFLFLSIINNLLYIITKIKYFISTQTVAAQTYFKGVLFLLSCRYDTVGTIAKKNQLRHENFVLDSSLGPLGLNVL